MKGVKRRTQPVQSAGFLSVIFHLGSFSCVLHSRVSSRIRFEYIDGNSPSFATSYFSRPLRVELSGAFPEKETALPLPLPFDSRPLRVSGVELSSTTSFVPARKAFSACHDSGLPLSFEIFPPPFLLLLELSPLMADSCKRDWTLALFFSLYHSLPLLSLLMF